MLRKSAWNFEGAVLRHPAKNEQTPPSLEGIGPPKKQLNQLLVPIKKDGMSLKRQQSCVKKKMTSFISACIECILIFIFHDVGSSCRTLFHPIFINLICQAQIDLGARCDPANLRIHESCGQKTAVFLGTKNLREISFKDT